MTLVGILVTQSTTTYGMTSRGVPMYLFKPMDPKLIPRKVAWKDADRSQNHWVLIRPVEEVSRIPRGELIHVIGPCGEWSAERSALVCSVQPAKWPKQLPPITFLEERSLLNLPTIHIDPPGCRDIDDAISIQGNHFAITIADVAAWVEQNPWLCKAEEVGQTLYSTAGEVLRPMLPRCLSEDLISLKPGERRKGVALVFDWTPEAGFDHVDFQRVDIVVHGSYTYETAHTIQEFPVETLKALVEHLVGHPSDDPHEWVESLMIFYGRVAALALREKHVGILRCQSPPDREKLERYTAVCPETEFLCQSAAVYMHADEATPHYGLDAYYCHITSPIRRWVDVLNQFALLQEEGPVYDLTQINARDKQLKKFRRDMFFLDALEHPEETITGKVIDLRETKCKVWIREWNHVISLPRTDLALGETIRLKYHQDMGQTSWKKRLVFEVIE